MRQETKPGAVAAHVCRVHIGLIDAKFGNTPRRQNRCCEWVMFYSHTVVRRRCFEDICSFLLHSESDGNYIVGNIGTVCDLSVLFMEDGIIQRFTCGSHGSSHPC